MTLKDVFSEVERSTLTLINCDDQPLSVALSRYFQHSTNRDYYIFDFKSTQEMNEYVYNNEELRRGSNGCIISCFVDSFLPITGRHDVLKLKEMNCEHGVNTIIFLKGDTTPWKQSVILEMSIIADVVLSVNTHQELVVVKSRYSSRDTVDISELLPIYRDQIISNLLK